MLMNDAKPRAGSRKKSGTKAARSARAPRRTTLSDRAAIEAAFARLLSGVPAAALADLLAPRDEGCVH